MTKENGYLQHRRGIWEHVRDGRLSLQDVAVHQYIASQADTRTGIWNGSAGALAGELCISSRVARRFLERLSRGDYIRRFPAPGKHVCYPILVHKFAITNGEHRGEHLNALASSSPVDLRYFPGEQMGEHRGEQLSSQKRIENREQIKDTPAAKTAAPPDARFKPFFNSAYEAFTVKHERKPLWAGKDRNGLKNLLKGQSAESLPLERLQTLWRHFLDSTELFTAKQGDSLAYFCSNIDKFSDGPILAVQGKGAPHGKDVNSAVETTMRGFAANAGLTN